MGEARVTLANGAVEVDAAVVAPLLGVPAAELTRLMREREVTCVFERGEETDAGTYRLTFRHRGCRARIVVDASGQILRRSAVDYGSRPMPRGSGTS